MTDPTIKRQRFVEAQQRREQRRREEEAEQRRHEQRLQREHERQRAEDARERARLGALEREWAAFKSGVVQAQREAQRVAQARAVWQTRWQLIEDIGRIIRPPQPPPVAQHYLPSEGSAQLGSANFNVELMSRPLRWW